MAYRESADPRKVEELFALAVSTARGRELVGFVAALSIVFWVALAVSIFGGTPPEIEDWVWTMPVGGAILGALAFWIHARRRRHLFIHRVGEELRLVVPRENITLDFPIACHGTQMTVHIRGLPIYEVYLQLVGSNRQAVTLHESRGAIHGPQSKWFANDIDRSVSGQLFDVSGAGTLAAIVDRIEDLSHERT